MPNTAEDLFQQIENLHLMSAKDIEAVKSRWFRPGRSARRSASPRAPLRTWSPSWACVRRPAADGIARGASCERVAILSLFRAADPARRHW